MLTERLWQDCQGNGYRQCQVLHHDQRSREAERSGPEKRTSNTSGNEMALMVDSDDGKSDENEVDSDKDDVKSNQQGLVVESNL